MTFKSGEKEISWNTYADKASEMTDEKLLAVFEKDPGSEAQKIVRLAKQALNSDNVEDTRNFLEALNNTETTPYDLASLIEENQSGPFDAIVHAFSSNPSISWDWDSHPNGRWASDITFKLGNKELRWHNYLRNVSEMSDSDVNKYKVDYAELRRQGEENARQYELYTEQATEEAGELSSLAQTVLEDPDSAEAQQALLVALKKTEPLKTSLGIENFEASWKGRSGPKIDISTGAHPMGDWINFIKFRGSGREIFWKPGDEKVEVKEDIDV